MKSDGQPIRDSVPWNSRCTKDPRWLNNIFLFSTEIWAEQLKKTPCTYLPQVPSPSVHKCGKDQVQCMGGGIHILALCLTLSVSNQYWCIYIIDKKKSYIMIPISQVATMLHYHPRLVHLGWPDLSLVFESFQDPDMLVHGCPGQVKT